MSNTRLNSTGKSGLVVGKVKHVQCAQLNFTPNETTRSGHDI